MKTLRRRAALAGVIAVASVLGLSSPALAHATIRITAPGAGTKLDKPTPVTVSVTADDGTTVNAVRLVVEQLEPVKRTFSVDDPSAGSNPITVPFTRNGKYRLTPRVRWTHDPLLPLNHNPDEDETPGTSADLSVAIPPAPPSEVRALVNAETRVVTVTWNPNAEEDMLGYAVLRTRAGGQPEQVGTVEHPKNSFADTASAEAGGEYTYQVLAVRAGATDKEPVASAASVVKTSVPDPPPPPTTAPPAGSGTTVVAGTPTTAASGTASTVPSGSPGALATSGKVDLSGFTTIQNQTRRSAPRPAPEVDTGFQSTLPFDIPEGEQQAEAEEGGELGEIAADSPQLRELGSEDDGAERHRSLAFLAAGLLATVLLMHVLWVKSEVEKVPLEAVAPEGPQPVAAGFRPPGSPAKVPPMAKPPKTPTARFRADGGSRSGQRGSKVSSGV